jgi:2,4-dienoyl-CoA reductase-like NADH-dependent reductase (Old Yellow Enzyme family)
MENGNKSMAKLFEPFSIGALEVRNRFVRSATWDNTAGSSGAVTDTSISIYQQLGYGGVGLIITGFAYVAPLGQALPRQYGAHSDAMIPGLQRLVRAAHRGGAKIALQLVHAGINSPYLLDKGITALAVTRRANIWPGLLPTLSQKQGIDMQYSEIAEEDIDIILSDFASAAARAREADFDAVQLHGAHGYLMSQFLSPLFNLRTDRWGGNAENRRRFHLELVRKVRQAVGSDFPLMIKFGVQDDQVGGLPLGEGLETVRQMVEEGVSAIEVSGAFRDSRPVAERAEPGQVPFRERAAAVKRVVSVPVMVVGGIRSIETARTIIDCGDADLISMCRPFIQEPGLISRWQSGDKRPSSCISCLKCHSLNDEPVQCRVSKRGSTHASNGYSSRI